MLLNVYYMAVCFLNLDIRYINTCINRYTGIAKCISCEVLLYEKYSTLIGYTYKGMQRRAYMVHTAVSNNIVITK